MNGIYMYMYLGSFSHRATLCNFNLLQVGKQLGSVSIIYVAIIKMNDMLHLITEQITAKIIISEHL